MNGAKRSAEAVGCKNASVGERSALEGRTRASSGGRSGSENVGLSNANIGENPMPRKPKGSSARFVHGGVSQGLRSGPPGRAGEGVVDGTTGEY
ncbi:Protein root UVB sensitive 1, chloroplastic, partial [Quillaja saponaria]